jgi:hypothetical protein
MPSEVYANAKLLMATDALGWTRASYTFRGLLVGVGYAFNATHTYVSDVAGQEVSGGTYARVSITGRSASLDLGGNRALLRANNPLFPALSGVTPAGLVIYRQVGGSDVTPGDDPLVCFTQFVPTPATGLNYLVEFDSDGIFALGQC